METKFTVFNDGIELDPKNNRVLVYLKPEKDDNIISCAWQSVTPQIHGSVDLATINNTISARIEAGSYKTAEKVIPLQNKSKIIGEEEGAIRLTEPESDPSLSPGLCYLYNDSTVKGLKSIWCLNHNAVCKSRDNLMRTATSTFNLENKIYLTVGSKQKGENFEVQTWTSLKEYPITNGLKSAEIHVSMDPKSNEPVFEVTNEKY